MRHLLLLLCLLLALGTPAQTVSDSGVQAGAGSRGPAQVERGGRGEQAPGINSYPNARPLTLYEHYARVKTQALWLAAAVLGLLLALLWWRLGYELTYVYWLGSYPLLLLLTLMLDAATSPGMVPKEFMLRLGAGLMVLNGYLAVLSVRNLVVKTSIPLVLSVGGLLLSLLLGCLFALAGAAGGMVG